jgi:methylenetetrahydrofolate dehydrogenase (NADP+)/methenyltetrahydrofolate cyclohydrolase
MNMGKFIPGKLIAETICETLSHRSLPELVIIQIGSDPASSQFVAIKQKRAEKIGIVSRVYAIPDMMPEPAAYIEVQNILSTTTGGIILQLPLPSGWNTEAFLKLIPAGRDIDLLNPEHYTAWKHGKSNMMPPTVFAVWQSLLFTAPEKSIEEILATKHITLVGHGKLVGKPVSDWLNRMSIPHSIVTLETPAEEKKSLLISADIIISGSGSPHSVQSDDIKPGCVLIDCGTAESNGSIKGDIHPNCIEKCHAMTPVPGGIGPLTVAGVFVNMSLME